MKSYLSFVYNFKEWKWGKNGRGSLILGLAITGFFIFLVVRLPEWWKLIGVFFLIVEHWAFWRNWKGKQA